MPTAAGWFAAALPVRVAFGSPQLPFSSKAISSGSHGAANALVQSAHPAWQEDIVLAFRMGTLFCLLHCRMLSITRMHAGVVRLSYGILSNCVIGLGCDTLQLAVSQI